MERLRPRPRKPRQLWPEWTSRSDSGKYMEFRNKSDDPILFEDVCKATRLRKMLTILLLGPGFYSKSKCNRWWFWWIKCFVRWKDVFSTVCTCWQHQSRWPTFAWRYDNYGLISWIWLSLLFQITVPWFVWHCSSSLLEDRGIRLHNGDTTEGPYPTSVLPQPQFNLGVLGFSNGGWNRRGNECQ